MINPGVLCCFPWEIISKGLNKVLVSLSLYRKWKLNIKDEIFQFKDNFREMQTCIPQTWKEFWQFFMQCHKIKLFLKYLSKHKKKSEKQTLDDFCLNACIKRSILEGLSVKSFWAIQVQMWSMSGKMWVRSRATDWQIIS